MGNVEISVVVSAYNRCDKLRLAIDALSRQKDITPDEFDVIVIDNNSKDDTKKVALRYAQDINLTYQNQPLQGLGFVRQKGFELSRGEYVAYLDDDAIPEQNWLEAIHKLIEEQQPDCICGPIFPYYDNEKPPWFIDDFEIRTKGADQRYLAPGEEASGSNMVWKREVLEILGGFDVTLGMVGEQIAGGEDSDLFKRYWSAVADGNFSGEIIYSPDVIVNHWTPEYKMRRSYILKRNYAAGIAAARMRRDVGFWVKVFQIIRLSAEAMFVFLRMPFTRGNYAYSETWQVEELRKAYFRLGWILTYLGKSKNPTPRAPQEKNK